MCIRDSIRPKAEESRKSQKEKVMKKLKFENTATIKKSVKRRKLDKSQISSSESDTGMSTHDTDDDLSDELEDLEELKDFNLSAGDFVLVRFPVKNSMVHFIGQIL